MVICKICGETQGLSGLAHIWSPDDGWVMGRLCHGCRGELRRTPSKDDLAWDRRHDYVWDNDDYIDGVYGNEGTMENAVKPAPRGPRKYCPS